MSTAQTQNINGVDVNQLTRTISQIQATPVLARFKFRLSNQWLNAGRNSSTIEGFHGVMQDMRHGAPFRLDTDEPPVLLGEDSAPNPGEYLLHALAACVTSAMVYHAAARGIQIQEVESEVSGDIDLHGCLDLDKSVRSGYQGILMTFRIRANVPDSQIEELIGLGAKFSPVLDSLTKGVPVSISATAM